MVKKTIKILDFIGKNAVSMERGKILHAELQKNIKEGVHTTVDFEGVQIASPFFNASISLLLSKLSIKEVQKQVSIIGLDDNARSILNLSIHNALEHYGKT